MSRCVVGGLGVLALTGCVVAAAATTLSGVEMQYADRSVRPQDDLYRYLNGKWLDSFQLPADKGSYGSFTYVDDTTQEQLRAIVDGLSQTQTQTQTQGQGHAETPTQVPAQTRSQPGAHSGAEAQ